jgi:hypothetical protein
MKSLRKRLTSEVTRRGGDHAVGGIAVRAAAASTAIVKAIKSECLVHRRTTTGQSTDASNGASGSAGQIQRPARAPSVETQMILTKEGAKRRDARAR